MILYANAKGDRSPRSETHEPFDAGELYRYERAEFGSALSFLLERPASPIPCSSYEQRVIERKRRAGQKPRANRLDDTLLMYLRAFNVDWITRYQISAIVGKKPSTVFERMSRLLVDGYVEAKFERGMTSAVTYYAITDKGRKFVQHKSTNLQKD